MPGAVPSQDDASDSQTTDPAQTDKQFGGRGGGMGGSMGSSDVSLIYTDDDYDSYSNIFDNAKTDITDADQGPAHRLSQAAE